MMYFLPQHNEVTFVAILNVTKCQCRRGAQRDNFVLDNHATLFLLFSLSILAMLVHAGQAKTRKDVDNLLCSYSSE